MIPLSGSFEYEISVEIGKEKSKPTWIGKGRTLRGASMHPGLAGYAPTFELSEGVITLRSTEDDRVRRTDDHFTRYHRPVASFSCDVGDALAIALQNGDFLYVGRSGTGDLGLSVLRNHSLVLAMGALVGASLGTDVEVRDDPRLLQAHRLEDFIRLRSQSNLCVTVMIQNQAHDIIEGQELVVGPYYVFVERTCQFVIPPGQQSILSIARLTEKLTKEIVRNSTKKFTHRRISLVQHDE